MSDDEQLIDIVLGENYLLPGQEGAVDRRFLSIDVRKPANARVSYYIGEEDKERCAVAGTKIKFDGRGGSLFNDGDEEILLEAVVYR